MDNEPDSSGMAEPPPLGARLWHLAVLVASAAILAGCSSAVNYGKLPHSQYTADKRCGDEPPVAAHDGLPIFIATSRLPDCRSAAIGLTSFRSPVLRFGRAGLAAKRPGQHRSAANSLAVEFQSDGQWWQDLAAAAGASGGRILVYVHGFREQGVTSTADTLQIARLTGFAGPVVEYSWPSNGKLLDYAVDETNMVWDERNFRGFLHRLAGQSWTREVVLVAHSLGARAVLPAIEYVDASSSSADSSNISNIVLASPDVDLEDFERGIADEILSARRVNAGRHITIYVSSRDRALDLSRQLHGYPRLGSPQCFDPFAAAALKARGLPQRCYAAKFAYIVAPSQSGLTIVDTSAVSRKRSGHSDFLHSAPACLDFKAAVGGARGAAAGRSPGNLPHVFLLAPAAGKPNAAADRLACAGQ